MKKLAWHFDFHSHKSVRIGHDPDPEGTAEALADARVEEVIMFAKCHNGFSYYPTKVGNRHPRMKGDPFGDMTKACKAKGIKVLAYVSFGIDGEAGRKHHEWIQMSAPGVRPLSEDHFISVCPFTPYLDKGFLPQLKEIIENYDPHGFFFDTMGAFSVCYCAHCRKAFKKAHGRTIPVDKESEDWAVYGKFRHDRALKLLDRVGNFINGLRPCTVVGFNQIGSPSYPEKLPDTINRLTLDPPTPGPRSRWSSLCANYGSMTSRPSDVMPTRFNQGWGDWSQAPLASLESTVAPILVYGARLYMGDRLHPANRIVKGTRDALKHISALCRAMEAELPPEGTPRDPDVLLVHSPYLMYGKDMRNFATDARLTIRTLIGAHHLMLDAGCNFGIVAEDYLEKWLDPKRLLVLPELPRISRRSDALISKFIKEGGCALVIGAIPDTDARKIAWMGIEQEPKPWQDHIYLPCKSEPGDPVLVRGDCCKIKLRGAKGLLNQIPPYDLRHGVRMGWGINPPADKAADTPALTCFKFGKGKVYYLACPLFHDYSVGMNFQQKEWFKELLADILPKPALKVNSPSGNVEVAGFRRDNDSWAVLMNHGGEQTEVSGLEWVRYWPRLAGPLPAYPVTLTLRCAGNQKPASITCAGKKLAWKARNGAFNVQLIVDTAWKVVKIRWK